MTYEIVTELPGTEITREQLQRQVNRYHFAASHCKDKDVLELACGPGIGLGLLSECSRSLVAGDIDEKILEIARCNSSAECGLIDAQQLPFDDNSFDVVVLFEAIYYLKEPHQFVSECQRVLREGGCVIVCNPNKDLPDFNPSPFSYCYFNVIDFKKLFEPFDFSVECYGDTPIADSALINKVFSFAKRLAVRLKLMPTTMRGKKFLKRIVFGQLVGMPPDIGKAQDKPQPLKDLPDNSADNKHKVIFCVARLN
ncbi:MAG: methyltransferase domain-containing protein [Pseudomonadota bacterium]